MTSYLQWLRTIVQGSCYRERICGSQGRPRNSINLQEVASFQQQIVFHLDFLLQYQLYRARTRCSPQVLQPASTVPILLRGDSREIQSIRHLFLRLRQRRRQETESQIVRSSVTGSTFKCQTSAVDFCENKER